MRILIATQHFDYLSGAPVYAYELARVLAERGHFPVIASHNVGGDLYERADGLGIPVIHVDSVTKAHRLKPFDVLHVNQRSIAGELVRLLPGVPTVQTCHSEWPFEDPYIHAQVQQYVAIRPSIAEKIKTFGESPDRIHLIYNGVDASRFNREGANDFDFGLFVGTIDHLRREAAERFIGTCKALGKQAVFVGREFLNADWMKEYANVARHEPTWRVEMYVKNCAFTGGILLGRTTIEGLICGKSGFIYDVDLEGHVTKSTLVTPDEYDMKQFDANYMADKTLEVYALLR